jgi:hypothetical protein
VSVSVVQSSEAEFTPPLTPTQERAMAAIALLTVEPTDRALTGWCPFGTGFEWQEYHFRPAWCLLNCVSGYVWG